MLEQLDLPSIAASVAAQAPTGEAEQVDVFRIVLGLLAGLVLFLYGVTRLAQGLRVAAGERAKELLARLTKNRFGGVLTGTITTLVLDSSSVTIIMVIAMVDAGLLSSTQSLGVVMGSNIGTTFSSLLFATNAEEYAPLVLLTGFGLYALSHVGRLKLERVRPVGVAVLGLGLVFFGLEEMGSAVEPLKEHQGFADWMTRLENPLLGVLVGALVTLVIQSSSATLGLIIALATQGLITLPAGIGLMLGAEIGTCSDTLLATIGRSREAIRTGLFHLTFNVVSVAIGVILAVQLGEMARVIAGDNLPRQIAVAQLVFNVAGMALFIAFVPQIVRLLKGLIPDGPEGERHEPLGEDLGVDEPRARSSA